MASSVTQMVNGADQGLVSTADRGLGYGHGVFETMRLAKENIPLWAYHRERLQKGLSILQIPFEEDLLEQELSLALTRFPAEGIVKIMVTAGSGGRGYRTPKQIKPVRIIQWYPLPQQIQSSVSLQQCSYRLPVNPVLAGIKHLNRLDQVLAANELKEACQGLLLDGDDQLIEALSHNLFLYLDGQWHTPDLSRCGVAGVMRQLLIDKIIPAVGKRVMVRDIPLADLVQAEEVFICNSVAGVLPVSQEVVSGHQWYDFRHCRNLQIRLQEHYSCFTA